jgi:hypothetical protein
MHESLDLFAEGGQRRKREKKDRWLYRLGHGLELGAVENLDTAPVGQGDDPVPLQ